MSKIECQKIIIFSNQFIESWIDSHIPILIFHEFFNIGKHVLMILRKWHGNDKHAAQMFHLLFSSPTSNLVVSSYPFGRRRDFLRRFDHSSSVSQYISQSER